jgi:hypothetical protein
VQCGNRAPRFRACEQKISKRNKFRARIDAKISAPSDARDANQSALIRSFLIDSDRCEAFGEANCEKNFCL